MTNNMINRPEVAFSAYLGTADLNVTGNNSLYQLGSGNALTKEFDLGNNLNVNGTFTAPKAGRYFVQAQLTMTGLISTHNNAQIQFGGSASYLSQMCNPYAIGGNTCTFTIAEFLNLSAGNTVTVWIAVAYAFPPSVSTYIANKACSFSGYLVF